MMGRLTRWSDYDAAIVCDNCPRRGNCNIPSTCLNVLADRLAAYEDTGLEPEVIKEHENAYIEIMTRTYGPLHQKIAEWLKADREGRLIVLPYGFMTDMSK